MTTSAEMRRVVRRGERGQALVLFLLIFMTMVLAASVAVVIGQTLVRRQHAQMIVDAAALAGAAKQAEGMNTIAHWNQMELWFMQAIHVSLLVPYMDSSGTTLGERSLPLAVLYWRDWAGDAIEKYQKVFDFFNGVINAVNLYYSKANLISGPIPTADKVVKANFGGDPNGDRLFRGEQPLGYGPLVGSTSELTSGLKLVELTDPEEYKVEGYTYVPAIEEASYLATCAESYGLNVHACSILANYAMAAIKYGSRGFWDPIKFKFGRFYKDNQREVRFGYYLQVKNTPVIFGKKFFDDVPPITVLAAAKPYGGYLGYKFNNYIYWTSEKSNKEISPTYKVKLVPLTYGERVYAAFVTGQPFDTKWLGVLH